MTGCKKHFQCLENYVEERIPFGLDIIINDDFHQNLANRSNAYRQLCSKPETSNSSSKVRHSFKPYKIISRPLNSHEFSYFKQLMDRNKHLDKESSMLSKTIPFRAQTKYLLTPLIDKFVKDFEQTNKNDAETFSTSKDNDKQFFNVQSISKPLKTKEPVLIKEWGNASVSRQSLPAKRTVNNNPAAGSVKKPSNMSLEDVDKNSDKDSIDKRMSNTSGSKYGLDILLRDKSRFIISVISDYVSKLKVVSQKKEAELSPMQKTKMPQISLGNRVKTQPKISQLEFCNGHYSLRIMSKDNLLYYTQKLDLELNILNGDLFPNAQYADLTLRLVPIYSRDTSRDSNVDQTINFVNQVLARENSKDIVLELISKDKSQFNIRIPRKTKSDDQNRLSTKKKEKQLRNLKKRCPGCDRATFRKTDKGKFHKKEKIRLLRNDKNAFQQKDKGRFLEVDINKLLQNDRNMTFKNDRNRLFTDDRNIFHSNDRDMFLQTEKDVLLTNDKESFSRHKEKPFSANDTNLFPQNGRNKIPQNDKEMFPKTDSNRLLAKENDLNKKKHQKMPPAYDRTKFRQTNMGVFIKTEKSTFFRNDKSAFLRSDKNMLRLNDKRMVATNEKNVLLHSDKDIYSGSDINMFQQNDKRILSTSDQNILLQNDKDTFLRVDKNMFRQNDKRNLPSSEKNRRLHNDKDTHLRSDKNFKGRSPSNDKNKSLQNDKDIFLRDDKNMFRLIGQKMSPSNDKNMGLQNEKDMFLSDGRNMYRQNDQRMSPLNDKNMRLKNGKHTFSSDGRNMLHQSDKRMSPSNDKITLLQNGKDTFLSDGKNMLQQSDKRISPSNDRNMHLQNEKDMFSSDGRNMYRQNDQKMFPSNDKNMSLQNGKDRFLSDGRNMLQQSDKRMSPSNDKNMHLQNEKDTFLSDGRNMLQQSDKRISPSNDTNGRLQNDKEIFSRNDKNRLLAHDTNMFQKNDKNISDIKGSKNSSLLSKYSSATEKESENQIALNLTLKPAGDDMKDAKENNISQSTDPNRPIISVGVKLIPDENINLKGNTELDGFTKNSLSSPNTNVQLYSNENEIKIKIEPFENLAFEFTNDVPNKESNLDLFPNYDAKRVDETSKMSSPDVTLKSSPSNVLKILSFGSGKKTQSALTLLTPVGYDKKSHSNLRTMSSSHRSLLTSYDDYKTPVCQGVWEISETTGELSCVPSRHSCDTQGTYVGSYSKFLSSTTSEKNI